MIQCKWCHHDLVYIKKSIYKNALKITGANFKTKSKKVYSKFGGSYLLCPICDAYGLGAELDIGFPVFLRDGTCTDVHKIIARVDGSADA